MMLLKSNKEFSAFETFRYLEKIDDYKEPQLFSAHRCPHELLDFISRVGRKNVSIG